MNDLIHNSITVLNSLGSVFRDYTGSMFVQSSILIVLLLCVDFLIRKRVRATLRYWIWMLVFIKLILPPSLSLPTGIGYWRGDILSAVPPALEETLTNTRPELSEPPLLVDETPLLFEIPQNQLPQTTAELTDSATPIISYMNTLTWQAVVFALWFVGVLVFSALLIQRILHVRRLIAQSELSENRFAEMLNQCREPVGIRRPIELRLSNNVFSPAVCGVFKPVILMPTALIENLQPASLRVVLTHELCHIKRGDLWINSIQTFLQIIYFYNPLVWLANLFVRRIREQAVDEMVLVAVGTGAKDYSNTLIDIAEMAFFRTSLSLRLISVVESKKALEGRIKQMLNRPIPKNVKLGIHGLAMILIFGAILLPMARAQKQSIESAAVDSQAHSKNESESTKIDIPLDAKNLNVIKLSDELIEITIAFPNQGSAPIPRFRVNFYAGDPDSGGRLLAPHASGPIMPGDTWVEGTHPQRLRPGEDTVSVVVDPDNQVDESDETNNKVSRKISMTASESDKVPKIGTVQKVNLAGDDILQIEAQEAKGFNFPFYLFIPRRMDKDRPVHMLVETNNSGTTSDDLDFHRVKAFKLAENSYAPRMASHLGVPLLVPTFPRPRTNWWIYTHALDIDTLEMDEGKLKRIDLQLTAMIKFAREFLGINGFKINDKVFMHGFSASAKFCNRYSYLHPEMVKAVAAGGVNGLPTLPVREWNGCELPFPIGIAGIERFIGGPFNEEAFRKVAHYIYMGSVDKNDTLPSRDAWREEEADIIKKALAEQMMPDRWELSQKIYSQQKLSAQLVTYNGVGHAIKNEMQDDIIDFFKENSGENYVRINPHEYPSVIVKEGRPEYETGSAKIDITPAHFDIHFDKNRGTCSLGVDIQNKSSLTIPRFKLNFYRGDPGNNLDEAGNVHRGWHEAGPLEPGQTRGEGTFPFVLPDGQYEFYVILDFDNNISEIDENNNQAVLKVKIENGRIADKSITCPSSRKDLKTDVQIGTKEKPTPSIVKTSGSDSKPNIFIMSPSRISLFREIINMVKDMTWNKTGRYHNKKSYDEIFIDEIHNKKPGDIIVLLFCLDSPDRIPSEYENLLPKPWPDIEAALKQGQTVELRGEARELNVFLLAAPTSKQLRSLVQESNLLNPSTKLTPPMVETSGFSATLPDGTTVGLVGVCEHPNDGKQCWRPDGSLMDKAPYKTTKKHLKYDEGYNDYEFVMRLMGPSGTSYRWSVPGGRQGTDTGAPVDKDGNWISDLRVYTVNQNQDKKTALVCIGVTTEEWDTLATHASQDNEKTHSLKDGSIAFGIPYEKDGRTLLPIVHNFNRENSSMAIRTIAITHSDKQISSGYSGSGGNALSSLTYRFHTPLDNIREFRFQVRPYTWIEFDNVSLRPGLKTDVKIKIR